MTCYQVTIGGSQITLVQTKVKKAGAVRFTVTYGKSVKSKLKYEEAATALGAAIMHALACIDRLDNREPNEPKLPGYIV